MFFFKYGRNLYILYTEFELDHLYILLIAWDKNSISLIYMGL